MRIPTWLKVFFAIVLVLVVVGVIYGPRVLKSYRIKRSIASADQLLEQKKYKEAIVALQPLITADANCERCFLLLMKAYLLSGDPNAADAARSKYKNSHFEPGPLLDEVNTLSQNAVESSALLTQVQEQAQAGHYSEALQLFQRAQKIFPYFEGHDDVLGRLQIADAFTRNDWDRYMEIAGEQFKLHPQSSEYAASYAGALATKWAVTGESRYKTQAEEMLAKAQSLAVTVEEKNTFTEYAERVRYRISSRQIIDKAEYDRRFRGNRNGRTHNDHSRTALEKELATANWIG